MCFRNWYKYSTWDWQQKEHTNNPIFSQYSLHDNRVVLAILWYCLDIYVTIALFIMYTGPLETSYWSASSYTTMFFLCNCINGYNPQWQNFKDSTCLIRVLCILVENVFSRLTQICHIELATINEYQWCQCFKKSLRNIPYTIIRLSLPSYTRLELYTIFIILMMSNDSKLGPVAILDDHWLLVHISKKCMLLFGHRSYCYIIVKSNY